MSKTVLVIIIAVVAAAGGGAYHLLTQPSQMPTASPAAKQSPEVSAPAAASKPTPDHGNFQKRFQPSMPPSGNGK